MTAISYKPWQTLTSYASRKQKNPLKYKGINSIWLDSKYTSGGSAILFKHSIARGISQYHTKLSSDAVITKLSKKFFNTKVDYYVVNYYVSPHNSPYRKRMTNDPWATLDEILSDLQGKSEIIRWLQRAYRNTRRLYSWLRIYPKQSTIWPVFSGDHIPW